MKKTTSKKQIEKEYVLERLIEVAEKCLSDEYFNPSAANRALELLGKHLSMFKDKPELTNAENIAEELRLRLEKFNNE
ncbi:MAG: hypothetical protein LBV09_00675 [Deferribacteraceae bacterium]|jgi:hypothetical protein|nr:hypothetical protein [Deferribacteraceae bacterium]